MAEFGPEPVSRSILCATSVGQLLGQLRSSLGSCGRAAFHSFRLQHPAVEPPQGRLGLHIESGPSLGLSDPNSWPKRPESGRNHPEVVRRCKHFVEPRPAHWVTTETTPTLGPNWLSFGRNHASWPSTPQIRPKPPRVWSTWRYNGPSCNRFGRTKLTLVDALVASACLLRAFSLFGGRPRGRAWLARVRENGLFGILAGSWR